MVDKVLEGPGGGDRAAVAEAAAAVVDAEAEEGGAEIRTVAVLTTASSRASVTGAARQPAYTGSVFITLQNSALNAAPFSLNGQSQPKPSSDNARFGVNIGGPDGDPQNSQLAERKFLLHLSRHAEPQSL